MTRNFFATASVDRIAESATRERRLLVCEGPHNPDLAALDRAVDQHRRDEYLAVAGPRPPITDDALIVRLRALRHTEHEQISATRWRCTTCGTERTY